ncbi:MAG: transglycosylase SLT domain-containing protein [Acidobacteriota bacterium]
MGKVLFNVVMFLPVIIFGCYEGRMIMETAPAAGSIENLETIQLTERSRFLVKQYGSVIRKHAEHYGLDWRLVMAVIEKESRFDPDAVSERGASGLMQITRSTQCEIASEWGVDSAHFDRPHENIRGGIYYLSKIYKSFDAEHLSEEDRLSLTLAAYNAGLGRVQDAQAMAEYVNDNPNQWRCVRNALSLLSKKYATLHRHVWDTPRPPNGYFRDWKQTVQYVDGVMKSYNELRTYLPKRV